MTTAAIPEATKVAALADALRALAPIRLTSTIAVLQGARITPTSIAVTNLEVSATVALSGLDLDVLVHAGALRAAVEGFDPKADLVVGTDGGILFLRAGRAEADLPLMDPADYPALPEPVEAGLNLDAEAFEELRLVARMASADETRPVIQGVRIRWDESGLYRFTATDSYRLGTFVGQAEATATAGDVLIPAAAINALSKGDGLGVGARPDGSHVTLYRGPVRMVVRTIDGVHPDPDTLIPSHDQITQARFTEEAMDEIERVATTVGGRDPLRLTFTPNSRDVVVEARNDALRRASTVSLTEAWPGREPLTIGANPQFFVAQMRYGRGAVATISPLRPILMEDGGRRGLLMPIRVSN